MKHNRLASLPPSHERIEYMKDEVYELMEEIEHDAWESHDHVRDLRVTIGRLFASLADYGNTART